MTPTNASLHKRIEALEAALREERIRTGNQSQRAEKAETRCYEKDQELSAKIKAHETALYQERRARENAESIYDQHRSAVLHYFMAASNPETAKDVDRLKDLQSIVCGLVPSRSPQPKQPWEL